MHQHTNLTYGIDKSTGLLMHIDKVPRGLDCHCNCPECGAEFVAKKGDVLVHHFAHSKDSVFECQGHGVAHTFIHKHAVKILKASGPNSSQSYGDFISDACVPFNGTNLAHIEVVVHSRMKDEKLHFIKTAFKEPIAVFRIDLSREEEQREFLTVQADSGEVMALLVANAVRIETYYELMRERYQMLTVLECLGPEHAHWRSTAQMLRKICVYHNHTPEKKIENGYPASIYPAYLIRRVASIVEACGNNTFKRNVLLENIFPIYFSPPEDFK